jgi:hypothetical protein
MPETCSASAPASAAWSSRNLLVDATEKVIRYDLCIFTAEAQRSAEFAEFF